MILTSLDAALLLIVYCLYRFGVKSNAIYKKTQAFVLGISGDSGAGKSILMHDIKQLLGHRLTEIEGDGDHKWVRGDKQWNAITHLNPKGNYLHRQADNIFMLKHGTVVWRPMYDHKTGTFTKPMEVKPYEFIAISGLHSFYLPKMRKLIDLKIYLDPAPNLRTHWKIMRDMKERGHSQERILTQLHARANDLHTYIEPQRDFSDLVIHYYTDNPIDASNRELEYPLKLKIILDSSVRLEHLIQILQEEQVLVHWDYANDLKTQYLIVGHPVNRRINQKAAKILLGKMQDLAIKSDDMLDGYRGFVQLIILIMLSEKIKEQESVQLH